MLLGSGLLGDLVGDPLQTINSGGTLQFTTPQEQILNVTWTVKDQVNFGGQNYLYFNATLEDSNAISPDSLDVPTPTNLPVTTVVVTYPGITYSFYNPFPLKIANITTRLSDIAQASDLFTSDLGLVLPQFHTIDMFTKEGGFHTSILIGSSVDALFLPGIIVGSDSSETVRYQHRKMFVKNFSLDTPYFVKVYGFNTRSNRVIKWALEKGLGGVNLIDGSEAIANYLTPPGIYGTYSFTELYSNQAITVGPHGVLSEGRGQGVWLRQQIFRNTSDMASDIFQFGILWSALG